MHTIFGFYFQSLCLLYCWTFLPSVIKWVLRFKDFFNCLFQQGFWFSGKFRGFYVNVTCLWIWEVLQGWVYHQFSGISMCALQNFSPWSRESIFVFVQNNGNLPINQVPSLLFLKQSKKASLGLHKLLGSTTHWMNTLNSTLCIWITRKTFK